MIVTTGGRTDSSTIEYARKIAGSYGCTYVERNKKSISMLKSIHRQDITVVSRKGISVTPLDEETSMSFHPNMAMVRARRLLNNEEDAFISAAELEPGMRLLDCTMGLASDSIIASLVTGSSGEVTAVEADPLLHMVVSEGLKIYESSIDEMNEAMRRITTIHSDHHSYLKTLPDDAFDVVYFDPMFHESIEASNGIQSIHSQAHQAELTKEIIDEARRVAARRIVLKDHFKSSRFSQLGFSQLKRRTSLFHYGYMDV
ncbi:class I SAM-dependent methyltransferase [Salinicoccus hispanicus]|uniref:Class I SAM-dependent methyltransferase n=1 Tax=Salinicoccus hispanicus TaxID=157225 RepID=A0A6N8U300_9STAP|nr:class I SAM-dependent methyltransferase [Salinicoccus hispanicus]MXQ50551.1 class I SAM-dependent methyltransferase [Salinicoccus hispanicus]